MSHPTIDDLSAWTNARSDEHGCCLGLEFLARPTEGTAPALYGRLVDL